MNQADLKNTFESQGYIKIPQALEPEELENLESCTSRLTDEFVRNLISQGKLHSASDAVPIDQRIVSILEKSGACWRALGMRKAGDEADYSSLDLPSPGSNVFAVRFCSWRNPRYPSANSLPSSS